MSSTERQAERQPELPAELGPANARPLRVLLADDTACVRRLVEHAFGRAGVELSMVADGVEAVRAARSAAFDVMVFDMEMPRLGGAEALRALRTFDVRTPAIAFTGSEPDAVRQRLKAAGFADVVQKSADYNELLRRCYALAAA